MSESAPILSSPSSSSSSSSTGNSLLPGSDLFRMSDAVVLADGVHAYLHSQGPKPHANLDWQVISKRMSTLNTKRLTWTAEHCCMLWKYLAYGIWLKAETVLSYESDEEDYYFSPEHADFKYKQHQVSSKTDNPVGFQRDISRKVITSVLLSSTSLSTNLLTDCFLVNSFWYQKYFVNQVQNYYRIHIQMY